MGFHKGKKKMDQMSMVRYFSPAVYEGMRFPNRRIMNKYRRVLKNCGAAYAAKWKAKYGA